MVSLVRTTHCFLEAPGILSLSLSCLMWFVQLSDDELVCPFTLERVTTSALLRRTGPRLLVSENTGRVLRVKTLEPSSLLPMHPRH